jgi:DNA-binding LacI/PurR family transcriptional regulator
MYTPRWKEIADSIRAEIELGVLAPGDMLPSEVDMAARWNVSHVTAHRALRELQQEGIVIRRRKAGTIVARRETRATGQIAVFLHTRDYLEQEYLNGIRAGLPDELDLLLCDIRWDPEREAHYLRRMQYTVDGILLNPSCHPANSTLLNSLIKLGTKIVCIDEAPDYAPVDAVITDNYQGTRDALDYMVSLGHRRIAHFTSMRPHAISLMERLQAYRDVMSGLGVPDPSRYIRDIPIESIRWQASSTQAVEDAMSALLHLPKGERPTCFFCVHDYMLSAVVRAYQRMDPQVTAGVEILSFNDCPPIVPHLPPNVHRIVQPAYEVGRLAAQRLISQQSGHDRTGTVRLAPDFYPAPARPD